MAEDFVDFPKLLKKDNEKKSIKEFTIDTSHYKSKGPKVVRTIQIDF